MKKATRIMIGIPLIIILSAAQILLTVFSMLGAAITTVTAVLMYLALAVILLFQLQPVREIAGMGIIATGILLSPLLIVGGTTLVTGLKQILILWVGDI